MKGLFQCPPWARSFWAFSPYLNHMRNFSTYFFLPMKEFLLVKRAFPYGMSREESP